MKCPHYKLSSCKPPRCPVSLPIFSVSQKRRLPTVANVDSHRFLTTYKAWAVKMEPTEWKQQSPERQRSAGKPAESCQSRQGPRIMQGKRLQCKNSFHPPPPTSKWSRPRLCRLPYSPRAHTQQPRQSSRRLCLTLAWQAGERS